MRHVCLLALLVFSCEANLAPQLCPQSCVCQSTLSQVTCRDVQYKEIRDQLPRDIKHLVLDNVPLPQDTLSADIFSTELASSITQLIWRASNIQTLLGEFNAKLPNVEHIDLSANKLHTISNDAFANNLNLNHLNLSNNQLSTIELRAFDNLDQLKELYLNQNQLALTEQVFSPLWNLQLLDLSHNKLTMLDNYYFLPNKKMAHLYLNHNNIATLSKQSLINMNQLLTLDLSHNKIQTLPPELFQSLEQLQTLNISNNELASVINDSFSSMRMLKTLDMSFNEVSQLSDNTFSENKKLEALRIDNTLLTNLKTELLAPLTQLVQLYVSNNQHLTQIDNEILYNKPKLRHIDLSHNGLTSLPHSLVGLNLSSLDMSDNPWTCDCNMAWFAEYWSQNKLKIVPNKHTLFCTKTIYPDLTHSPLIPTLRGLNCTPAEITYTTAQTYFLPRQNITLDCVVSGEPTPTITWLTPQGLTFHWIPEYSVSATFKHHPTVHDVNMVSIQQNHLVVLHNGSLLIQEFNRGDRGNYSCFVSNPFSNTTRLIPVTMDPIIVYYAKMESIAFGFMCAALFLLGTLLVQLLILLCKTCCGLRCCGQEPNQIQSMLDNIDQCRAQQLTKLQENYYLQVTKIKENYVYQSQKIQESYKDQMENLKTIKRNGTTHLVSIREQYSDQMMRVRDYSTGQLNWVRENYVFQRNRVRKFSAHQMLRIRQNYKYQQEALTKMLEAMPTLDNCKSSCGYSMSTVYDEAETSGSRVKREEIPLGNMLVEAESHLSLYFTPPAEHSLSPNATRQPPTRIHGFSNSQDYLHGPATAQHVKYTMMSPLSPSNPMGRSLSNPLPSIPIPGPSTSSANTNNHTHTHCNSDSE
uniref:Carboxypeptidase N subunit 2 n=1 Tax=Cacopsylla melanoneura TaxID=428564 RepID=A0A8D8Q459_9HEMI